MKTLKKNDKIILKAELIEKVDKDLYAISFEEPDQYKAIWQLYDYEQEKLFSKSFYNIWMFYNNVACVLVSRDPNKYNFIRRNGMLLFQVSFDSCEDKLFKEPVMGAFIRGRYVNVALTGGIDLSKRELAKLMLREGNGT